ncbi:TetR family transcriptional regulator [Clavibacter tessellarius]|uniref:TetR family transcriptional regulator n=2 Tax=Clavibacter tessellarius TaxID=31965 RepID=A0A225CCK4_9MICO|nr:TetR/AcrR family transcriptional regulator C-terminal domain-containing protein [Clavibacter michiganensis]OQJ64477.1 TetR family transcriptional regulator [Clavibacter michiganensis subsp. tessellarius]UKF35287.1 TetR family transcriptional regulator [Clavibacter michiganensis subsp. tessellarius]
MADARGGRRLTRDDVASAALRILDEHGLPDLTMRRLGAALDVQPSALYWHYPDKQTLLAAVADRIVAGAAWDRHGSGSARARTAGVRAQASALRLALLAHRDGAEVVASTTALGLGAADARDALALAVAADGFPADTADRAAGALLHFVLGHVAHEQQRTQLVRLGVVAADPDAESEAADAFDFGIDLLVRGLSSIGARGAGPEVGPAGLEPTTSTV